MRTVGDELSVLRKLDLYDRLSHCTDLVLDSGIAAQHTDLGLTVDLVYLIAVFTEEIKYLIIYGSHSRQEISHISSKSSLYYITVGFFLLTVKIIEEIRRCKQYAGFKI